MKRKTSFRIFATIVGIAMMIFLALPVIAQDSPSVSTVATTDVQTAPTLSYGAANVLKLTQSKIADETIVAYVQKSGQGYGNLGASEIIYLHSQGVSDRVVTAMLDQEKKARDTAVAQSAQPTEPTSPQYTAPASAAAPAYQPVYVAPPVTYVQTAPAPMIVMRDSSPRLVDYGIYPRYGYAGYYPSYGYRGYGGCYGYGYSYPSFSFSVGFSGHHGGYGSHSGGYHGSAHYGGHH